MFGNSNNNSGSAFGGFGANKPSTGFGSGFGASNNNTSSIFGQSASNNNNSASSAFGSSNTGSAFGSSNNNTTSSFGGGFGSSGSTFGSNNASSSGSGSLFGNKPATSSFGGFGSSSNTSSPFGSSTAGGNAFGANNSNNNQPVNGTTIPFNAHTEKDLSPGPSNGNLLIFQTISAMPAYLSQSLEELRYQDYQQNRRYGDANTNNSGFGSSNTSPFGSNTNPGFGNSSSFGGNNNTSESSTFGSAFGSNNNNNNSTGGLFGNTNNNNAFGSSNSAFGASKPAFGSSNTGSVFGSNTGLGSGNSAFGSNTTTNNTPAFGFGNNNTSAFGSNNNNSGNTGGGLFGNNSTNTSSPFGQNNSNTGSAFGAAKPAFGSTGGGFGSTFGSNNNNSSAFGQANNNTNTGGGLFGQNNSNTNNSTGGLFGNMNNNTANNNTGGGLFGNNNNQSSDGLFGNKPAGTTGGLFGNNTTPSTNTGGFGSNNTSGGLFGSNTNTATNTSGGGLFGNNNNTSGASAFGNNTNAGGSLFGNKPAGTTGGLFGNNNATTTTGGGLFGNNNASNTTGGTGLFGNNNTTASTGGGLFGKPAASTTNTTSGGLFGPKPAGTGLFGNNQNNTTTFGGQTGTGSGLFGNNSSNTFGNNASANTTSSLFSQNKPALGLSTNNVAGNNQQLPQSTSLIATVDQNPYGNNSLFFTDEAIARATEYLSQGPMATPLTTNKDKTKKTGTTSAFRLTPKPLFSPARRTSSISSLTPNLRALTIYGPTEEEAGATSSHLALVDGSTANTSVSGNSLFGNRADELLLSSSAFSPRQSVRRLIINRNHSNNQSAASFTELPSLSGLSLENGEETTTTTTTTTTKTRYGVRNAILPPDLAGNNRSATLEQSTVTPGVLSTKASSTIVSGNNATTSVPNKDEAAAPTSAAKPAIVPVTEKTPVADKKLVNGGPIMFSADVTSEIDVSDHAENDSNTSDEELVNEAGYWMSPSAAKLAQLPRTALKKVKDYRVGRKGYGQIEFLKPVDLSSLLLPTDKPITKSQIEDAVFDNVVVFVQRACALYPDSSSAGNKDTKRSVAAKPPTGQGLNVPARISLLGVWSVTRDTREPVKDPSRRLYQLHLKRLQKLPNQEFVSFDAATGTWVFNSIPPA
ncbi:hypothetical protein D0Z03_002199 [Geotrichum reessii]|nr:hypothetical protein D0Z03_002199 [Galactomyces reessii]